MLGTIEITVVSDGTLAFPAETLWGDRAEDARGLLTSTFQPSSPVGLQINTILVNTGDKLVLIDAGCRVDKFQNTTGRLLGHLASAGYAPGDIDMILFTHCHFISDGKNASLVFPSAEFVASDCWRRSCFSRLFGKLISNNCYPRVLVSATPSPWPSTAREALTLARTGLRRSR